MSAIVSVDFDWSIESCDKAPRDLDYERNTEKYRRAMKLTIARCDIGVQLSVRPFVRSFVRPSSVHNLCQGAFSVAVIAGSMKPCIVITFDTHFKKAP